MKRHPKSCSCANCAYRSFSKRPSVQQLIDDGTAIDRLFYGKYLPLRERKLLEKLVRTRDTYDGVREQLLSTSGSSERTHSEYTFQSKGDDSKSSTVLKLVNLVDRGQLRSSNAILSSCCTCCSCGSLQKIRKDMKKHPHMYKKPDVSFENIARYKLKAEKRAKSRRKAISSKMRDVRSISRNIYSEACLCTKSLNDMLKRSSKALKTKIYSEDATISSSSKASNTDHAPKTKKKPVFKIAKNKVSVGSETLKRFPIKKDSLSLYRDKMRRKHARKKLKNKGVEICDSVTCKKMRPKLKKLHVKDDLICEPGTCDQDECYPDKCERLNKKVMKQHGLEDWECEPGICDPDECDPDECLKKIIARRRGNVKKRRVRHKMSGSSKPKLKTSATETTVNREESMNVKKITVDKYILSRSQSSVSVRKNHIEHTLKRCFCTLKLQQNKHNVKRIKSKKTMATLSNQSTDKIARMRKTQTKSAGIVYVVPPMGTAPRRLLPYECEPLVCTPGECNPYICQKRIQARYRRDDSIQTKENLTRMDTKGIKVHKPRVRYTRSQTIKSEKSKQSNTKPFLRRCFCTLKLFNKNITKKNAVMVASPRKLAIPYNTKLQDKHSENRISTKSSYIETSRSSNSNERLESYARGKEVTGNINMNLSKKQPMRIGSTFSFNIEFYKENIPPNDSVELTKLKRREIHDKFVNIHDEKKIKKRSSKLRVTQPSSSEMKEKRIFVGSTIPTCFCTLKLQKKGKNSKTGGNSHDSSKGTVRTSEICGPKRTSDYKSTSTSTGIRYDTKGYCIPGICDAYKSYEEIKKKEFKQFCNRHTTTKKQKRKSCMSMTFNRLSRNFKARSTQSYITKHIPLKDEVKYNECRHAIKALSRQAVCIGSNFSFSIDFYKDRSKSIIRDKIIPKNNINPTKPKNITNKLSFLENQNTLPSSVTENEDQSINVAPKLKRCLCTLKFQKKGKLNSSSGSNYQWSRPVVTQFIHVVQGKQYNEQVTESKMINKICIKNQYPLLNHSCNGIEKLLDQKNARVNLQKYGNVSPQCQSNIENNAYLTFKDIDNVESRQNITSTPIFKQQNEYQVGYRTYEQTEMKNGPFFRSYYAFNLKVSKELTQCNPTHCKSLYNKLSKELETDEIDTRVGMSTTRQKAHQTGITTSWPKSQMIKNRRHSKTNEDYPTGKRVTHIGSSMKYNLKFYKDTSSKRHKQKRLVTPEIKENFSQYDDNQYNSMIRQCFCKLGLLNKRKSRQSERSMNELYSKQNKQRRACGVRGEECDNFKQQSMKKRQRQSPAGDYISNTYRKGRFNSNPKKSNDSSEDMTNDSQAIHDKIRREQYKRILDECDPQECIKIMQNVMSNRAQDSANKHKLESRQTRFMSIGKSQARIKDNMTLKQYKRYTNKCDPEECRQVLQQTLKRGREQISAGDHMTRGSRKHSLKENLKLERYIDECEPEECKRILQGVFNRAGQQEESYTKEYPKSSGKTTSRRSDKCDPEECKKKIDQAAVKRKSIRTDRAARLARAKFTPDMPEELQKIKLKSQQSELIKYGSSFSINVEFFKDSVSDLNQLPSGASPGKRYQEPRKSFMQRIHSGNRRVRQISSGFMQGPSSVRSVKTDPEVKQEMSTVSQMLKKCVCSLKALNKVRQKPDDDHGDGPADQTRAHTIIKDTCKCKHENHSCKCKLETHKCKCKLKHHTCKCKLENHKCKCKLEHHKCKCKLPRHTCKCKLEDHTICKCKLKKHKCKCKSEKNICKCGQNFKNSEYDEQAKTQEKLLTYPATRSSIMRKCFCKLGVLRDKKSLQSKPSTESIPKVPRHMNYEKSAHFHRHPADMDTILPYSKKKFKRHSSRAEISKGPCNICSESVCPNCGISRMPSIKTKGQEKYKARGEEKYKEWGEENVKEGGEENVKEGGEENVKEGGKERTKSVKYTEKEKKEENETVQGRISKRKEWCIGIPSLPSCNIKSFFRLGNKEQDLKKQLLKPRFEMIVDSHTMNVRNKDDIIRELLAGNIPTSSFDYDDGSISPQGLTFEAGQVPEPVVDISINQKRKPKKAQEQPVAGNEMPDGQPLIPFGGLPHNTKQTAKTKKKSKKKPKQDKRSHPPGCKCCDCRYTSKTKKKKKDKEEMSKKSKKNLRIKPCYCGTHICKKETARLKSFQEETRIKIKECVCGSDVCRRRAKMDQHDMKRYLKNKKRAELQHDQERERRILTQKKREKELLKKRQKRDKKAMNQILANKKRNDLLLLGETVLDVLKFTHVHAFGLIKSIFVIALNPNDTWYRFKMAMQNPGRAFGNFSDNLFKNSGIDALWARTRQRFSNMRATKIVVAEMETHPMTNAMVHAGDKSKKRNKVKRPRTPIDFNCSPYMGSLRQKPCIFIYYLCPWFYPHCMGCMGLWRQFTDVLLFILAIGVWSPCILATEILRGLMCCLVCTG